MGGLFVYDGPKCHIMRSGYGDMGVAVVAARVVAAQMNEIGRAHV